MLKKYQLRSYNIRLVIALLITSGFGIIVINSANSAYTIRQCIGLAISLFLRIWRFQSDVSSDSPRYFFL